MPENPRLEAEILEEAWQAALSGKLTPSQSRLVQQAKGVLVAPTLPEPPTSATVQKPHVIVATDAVVQVTASDVQRNLLRHDVRDLVTSENVINLAMREPTAKDNIRITPQHIEALPNFYRTDRRVDISLLVNEVDRVLLPGFKEILSASEMAELSFASPTLSKKVHMEIMRAMLADRTRDMIGKLDRGIERSIAPLIPKIRNTKVRESVEACVDIWRANRQNPYLNFYERSSRSAENNPYVHWEYRAPLTEIDPRFLSMMIIEGDMKIQGLGAAFSESTQAIMLHEPEQDEMEFTELLSVIHELTHKKHNAAFIRKNDARSQACEDQAKAVPNDVMLGIVDEDGEAMASEVELLIAKTGFGTFDVGTLANSLGVTSERGVRSLAQILKYAAVYFGSTGKNDAIPPAFVAHIESEYRRLGARIFEKDGAGNLVEKF